MTSHAPICLSTTTKNPSRALSPLPIFSHFFLSWKYFQLTCQLFSNSQLINSRTVEQRIYFASAKGFFCASFFYTLKFVKFFFFLKVFCSLSNFNKCGFLLIDWELLRHVWRVSQYFTCNGANLFDNYKKIMNIFFVWINLMGGKLPQVCVFVA